MPYPYWPLGRLKLVLGAAPALPIDIAPAPALTALMAPMAALDSEVVDTNTPLAALAPPPSGAAGGAKPRSASMSGWSWRHNWALVAPLALVTALLAPSLAPGDSESALVLLLVVLLLPPVGLAPGTLVLAAIAAAGGALTTTHIEAGQQRRRRSLTSARNPSSYARDDVPVMMQVITDLH